MRWQLAVQVLDEMSPFGPLDKPTHGRHRSAIAKGSPYGTISGVPDLCIAQDPAADELLSRDPFALVVGMLLDQQFPMERAFAGPRLLAERMREAAGGPADEPLTLDPAEVAAADPEAMGRWMAGPPAVHRYPGSMARRVQALAAAVLSEYGGDVRRIWTDPAPDGGPPDGVLVRRRLEALPGFGRQKASIFVALLGKQLGVELAGWREAVGDYGEEGSFRSVADVRDAESLAQVRKTKQALKARQREG
ncbi:MAG: HhH-GPD-type base excision DNA repair protein [Actinomycetes bacterium]